MNILDESDKSGGPLACWPWMRGVMGTGYGSAILDGKQMTASRLFTQSWVVLVTAYVNEDRAIALAVAAEGEGA